MNTLDSPFTTQADTTSFQLCAAGIRGTASAGPDAVGLPGWVLHGDGHAPLTVTIEARQGATALVAIVHGSRGPYGDQAAHAVLRTLTREPHQAWQPLNVADAFNSAHSAVLSGAAAEARVGAALLVLRPDGQMLTAGVGDVRVYRVVDGYAGQLTRDRSNAPADPATWLGGDRYLPPETYGVPGNPGDRLLMCSAGVHNALSLEEITALAAGGPAPDAVTALVHKASQAGTGRATTAVIVDLPSRPVPVRGDRRFRRTRG